MSTFHGEIKEIPGISVDSFEKCESRAYFLSHCHFDHTYGLYEASFLSYLIRKRYYVYTSDHTARIIAHRKPSLKNHLKGLKLGTEILYIPGDEDRAIDEKYVTVTLIPAGHCFGSVMFLFETADVTVLFTGDFRISEDDLHKYKDFHDENGEVIQIDTLYVDTEFQSVEYPDFPHRSESVEYAVIEIKKWLRKSERRRVALHVSAEYGYEYIFNVIFKELGMKVFVNDTSWEFYSQVPHLVPGVTNDPNARIHLCSNRHETDSHEKCMKIDKDHTNTPENMTKNNSTIQNIDNNQCTNQNVHQNQSRNENVHIGASTSGNIHKYSSSNDNNPSSSLNINENTSSSHNINKNTSSSNNNINKNTSASENIPQDTYSSQNIPKDTSSSQNIPQDPSASGIINKSPEKPPKINPQTTKELKKAYLYMHFSARKWKNYIEGDKMYNTDYVANRTDVCFATHCSRNELIYFVNYISPKTVVGFRDPYIGPVNAKISY